MVIWLYGYIVPMIDQDHSNTLAIKAKTLSAFKITSPFYSTSFAILSAIIFL
jgi:hypothetical protein